MPGTLYLAPTIETAIEHSVSCLQADRGKTFLQPACWLVPSSGTIQVLGRRLGNTMGVRMYQFYGLARAVLDAAAVDVHELTDTACSRLVRSVLDGLRREGMLSTFAPVSEKPGFIQVVLEWLGEIKSQGISYEEVRTHALEPQRDQQLALIYQRYQEFLDQRSMTDTAGLLCMASEVLEQEGGLLGAGETLSILGFDQFTRVQLRLLEALSRQYTGFQIYLPWDSGRPDGSMGHIRLAHTRRELEKRLNLKVVPLEDGSWSPASLRCLRQALFEPDALPHEKEVGAVRCIAAASRESEVRQALKAVKKMLLCGTEPEDIALLAPHPEAYAQIVEAVAREYGLPVKSSRPLRSNPAVAALLNLLTLPPEYPWRATLDALRSPYIRQEYLTIEQVDMLERLSRERPVISGREQWAFALQSIPSGADEVHLDEWEPEEAAEQAGEIRLPGGGAGERGLLDGLNAFFDHLIPPPSGTYRSFTLWLQAAVLGIFPELEDEEAEGPISPSPSLDLDGCCKLSPEPERDREALNCALAAIRQMVEAAELSAQWEGEPVSWDAYRAELAELLLRTTIPPDPGLGGIRFGSLASGRWQPVDHLFILGLSEGEFPHSPPADMFYAPAERNSHPLPLAKTAPSEDASLWWQALSNCRKSLVLLRPRLDDKGTPWLPSPYWQAVLEKLPLVEVEEPPVGGLPAPSEAACVHELLAGLVTHPVLLEWDGLPSAPVPATSASAWSNVLEAYHVISARHSWRPAPAYEGVLAGGEVREKLSATFPSSYTWSASQLGCYGSCPYSFFGRYMLKLEPLPEPEEGMDSMQRGSLVHAILEALFSQLGEAGLAPCLEDQTDVLEQLEASCNQIMPAAPERYGFRPGALWRYEQQELRRQLRAFVAWECKENGSRPKFRPYRQELRFGFPDCLPVQINAGPGCSFRLRGVIDRVDRSENGEFRVIDYKSGSTEYRPEHAERGLAFQAPLYSLAAEQALPEGRVVESFYLLVGGRKACGGETFQAGPSADDWVASAAARAYTFMQNARIGNFPTAPVAGPGGRLPCDSFCDYTGLCRIDRRSRNKAQRWMAG